MAAPMRKGLMQSITLWKLAADGYHEPEEKKK